MRWVQLQLKRVTFWTRNEPFEDLREVVENVKLSEEKQEENHNLEEIKTNSEAQG